MLRRGDGPAALSANRGAHHGRACDLLDLDNVPGNFLGPVDRTPAYIHPATRIPPLPRHRPPSDSCAYPAASCPAIQQQR